MGETCRPPQTPRHSLRPGFIGDGGFGGDGTSPPTLPYTHTPAELFAAVAASPTDAPTLHEAAAGLAAGRYSQAAITIYRQLLTHHPGDAAAHVCLANLLAEAGDAALAQFHYAAALRAHPDMPEAHQGLGNLCAAAGDTAQAWQHWRLGYRDRVFNAWAYRGNAAPVRVLLPISVAGGNLRARCFLDDSIFAVTTVAMPFWTPSHGLPPHDLVLNAISDADLCANDLTQTAVLAAQSGARVLNHPDAVSATGRLANAARLAALPDIVVPRMALLPRVALARPGGAAILAQAGFTFPLLLRAPGFHTGQHFHRVHRPEAVAEVAAGLPGQSVLAIEYLDAMGADFYARKGRVMSIGGALYPLHWAASPDWKVHYFTAGMAGNAAHRAEEARFLADMSGFLGPRAVAALHAVAETIGLDYAGIDCARAQDGRLMLFEANATMVILPPPEGEMWDYRRPAAAAALEAAARLCAAAAGATIA